MSKRIIEEREDMMPSNESSNPIFSEMLANMVTKESFVYFNGGIMALSAAILTDKEKLGEVMEKRVSRRTILKGGLAGSVFVVLSSLPAISEAKAKGFKAISHDTTDKLIVPEGYSHNVLIRWGDPLVKDAPEFDPLSQSAEKQGRQFGYNNDFVGYLPLPFGSKSSGHGLLMVNHEYTCPEVMFKGWDGKLTSKKKEWVDIELESHGVSILEVKRYKDGQT